MTQTSTTQPTGPVDQTIAISGENGAVGKFQIMASAGEFNGIFVMASIGEDVLPFEITTARAAEIITALQAGIDYLADLDA